VVFLDGTRDRIFMCTSVRWEENGNAERAACWAVLLGNHDLAIEILLRSRSMWTVFSSRSYPSKSDESL
jgi:hypothetical protein